MKLSASLYSFVTSLILCLAVAAFMVPMYASAADCDFTRTLSQGDTGEDVRCLQVYLNSKITRLQLWVLVHQEMKQFHMEVWQKHRTIVAVG